MRRVGHIGGETGGWMMASWTYQWIDGEISKQEFPKKGRKEHIKDKEVCE